MAKEFKCCEAVQIIVYYAPSDKFLIRVADRVYRNTGWSEIFNQAVPGGKGK